MAKQLFVNNFTSTFIANVKAAATTGTPASELGYGILQLNSGASAYLVNPTGGDYYILTAYKRSGSVESNVEVMKVTAVDNSVINECRITVLRAQEGTPAQAYVPGDYISLRVTKGGLSNMAQSADIAGKQDLIGTISGIAKGNGANALTAAVEETDYVTPSGTGTLQNKTLSSTGDVGFAGNGRRITGDFSNSTISYRVVIQSSTMNGNTAVTVAPNGTAANSSFFAVNSSDVNNASTALMRINLSEMALISGATGTGTYLPMSLWTNNAERLRIDTSGRVGIGLTPVAGQGVFQVFGAGVAGGAPASSGATDANQVAEIGAGTVQLSFGAYANGDAWVQQRSASNFATNYGLGINPNGGRVFFGGGVQEARVAMGANNIDLSTGNVFTKTISGATTLTVSNTPSAGTVATFILDLTNGGSATITWWSGVKWVGGTAPTLTTSGRDVLGFFTHDGGTTWTGLVLGKDVK